jgi:hypothetical protein
MWGRRNTREISAADLLHSQWTDWQASLFVHVNETMAVDNERDRRRAYDRLKELVDPMTREITVNPKGKGQLKVLSAAMVFLFSNHDDALYVDANTRRFFVVRNPDAPAGAQMFKRIHDWKDSEGWQPHLRQYLLNLNADLTEMRQPPPKTVAFEDMIEDTKSDIDKVVEAVVRTWPCDVVSLELVNMVVEACAFEYRLPDKWHYIVKQRFNKMTFSLRTIRDAPGRHNQIRSEGKLYQLRAKTPEIATSLAKLEAQKERMAHALQCLDMTAMKATIAEYIHDL